jgi:hypothetical protein
MLTGSFAMAYYGQPRMTRDLDLVVALTERDVDRVATALSPDFYIDRDDALLAVQAERLFNLLHNESGIKVEESELRDVRTLLDESLDWGYLERWSRELGVRESLAAVRK